MTTQTFQKQNKALESIVGELKLIRNQLNTFLLLIPEESLKEYKNSSQIKKSYLESIKTFSPK